MQRNLGDSMKNSGMHNMNTGTNGQETLEATQDTEAGARGIAGSEGDRLTERTDSGLGKAHARHCAANPAFAELDARCAELRSDMQTRFAELRGDMRTRYAELRGDMDARVAELRSDMDARFNR